MKPLICCILLAGALAVSAVPVETTGPTASGTPAVCYVIPVKGMIERGLVYVVRRGVTQALRHGAALIVLEMDTPGGRVDAAEQILQQLNGLTVPTCTWVNPSAISAGAIIALGTDRIYMAPGSRIGDAMPVMMTPLGGVQEMPEDYREKTVSYVAALIRATAQRNGHDAALAEAMVRRTSEYKLGEETITKPGELLTLTNVEAERVVERGGVSAALLSAGTVDSLPALCAKAGFPGARIERVAVSPTEALARYIEMFSALLLIGGLLGLYIEFKTPGFGLPGILGLTLLALWFWGYHVAGLAGAEEMLLFVTGLGLLLIEVFVLPGFGLAGASGIALIAASLLMAMVEHYPGTPWYQPPMDQIQHALVVLSSSFIAAFLTALLIARFLPQTSAFRRFALEASERADEGFRAAAESTALVGRRGVALTALRPGGIGMFNRERLDVVSRGDFVAAGTAIVVEEAHGSRIVVRPLQGD